MDIRRAQDLLRHVTQDKDYGASMLDRISVGESIYLLHKILPACVKKAVSENNENDIGFYSDLIIKFRPPVLEKIKNAERLWVLYSDLTGYPYRIDGDMILLFDYTGHAEFENRLNKAGYQVSFRSIDPVEFKNEVGHMYRNGYQKMRFMDGKDISFEVEREELFSSAAFFSDDYMTNPGLQGAMIDFFQEFRKDAPKEQREEMLRRREDRMIDALRNAEYMVPCVKEEQEEQVEIAHPFIDLTDRISDKKEGEQVIAVPAFTDGFELDKCYEGHHENMLYQYGELVQLIEELGASGILINCLGVSYYMNRELMKKIR